MKAILLFLVLLNALFFGWARWVAKSPGAGDVATPEPDVEKIVLFGEKYPERAAQEAATLADAATAAVDAPVSAPEIIEVTDEPVITTSLDDTSPEDTPATPEPQAEPPPTPSTEPLADAVPGPSVQPEDAAPAVAAAAMRCATLGPFSKPQRAVFASNAVRELGGTVTERRERGRIWVGHWVHLAPASTRAAAIEVVESLRADGVSDIYIEPSEPLRNAISLGLFSDASRAETRAGKIRALGVRPQIRDRFREGDRIYLDLTLPQSATLDAQQFQLGPIELEFLERDCPASS